MGGTAQSCSPHKTLCCHIMFMVVMQLERLNEGSTKRPAAPPRAAAALELPGAWQWIASAGLPSCPCSTAMPPPQLPDTCSSGATHEFIAVKLSEVKSYQEDVAIVLSSYHQSTKVTAPCICNIRQAWQCLHAGGICFHLACLEVLCER